MKTAILVILFVSTPFFCLSDTLYLKDGRSIISETVWEQDGYYMYTAYGATIGISKEKIKRVEYSKEKKAFFQFDKWPFGVTVNQAIDIARINDVPLHKSGIISTNKHFHSMVLKHKNNTQFTYNANLLGHFSKVELFFTPISKKLHTVSIQWPNQQTKKDSKLSNEIISMISKKYGKPHGKQKKLFHSSLDWTIENDNLIEIQIRSTTIFLNYLHTDFRQLDYDEEEIIKIQKIKAGTIKDKDKF